jgi:putative addiction module CopG family antidote
MDVSITPELADYIRRKVATGPYSDPSEVVRDALRLMLEHDIGGRLTPDKDTVVATVKSLEQKLRERGVIFAALFGSIVHGSARPDSDIDVLIEVDSTAQFDLIDLVGIKNLLGDRLGRQVDIVEKNSLKPAIRDTILTEAEVIFG